MPIDDWFFDALRRALAPAPALAQEAQGAAPAGVLVLLYQREDGYHVLLNQRSERVEQHKREIAFPGGRWEPGDADLLACALREGFEEMGIAPEDVTVLGHMEPARTRTGYLVFPSVGAIPHPYPFAPDPREVAEVLEVPLHWLLNPASHRHDARLEPNGTLDRRYAYAFGPHLVYGATASIITRLVQLIQTLTHPEEPAEVPS